MRLWLMCLCFLTSVSFAGSKHVVLPDYETDPVSSKGDAADDTAIWFHPTDITQSLIVATDKKAGLLLYTLQGRKISEHALGEIDNIDSRASVNVGGQTMTVLAGSDRSRDAIGLYIIDASTFELTTLGFIDLAYEPYGVCVAKSSDNQSLSVFITTKMGFVDHYDVQLANGIESHHIQTFYVSGITEGCVVDDESQQLFVSEEELGIWRFDLEGNNEPLLIDQVGANGHLTADVEGIAIHKTPEGIGHLVVSSQGDNTFHIYDLGTFEHKGHFKIGATDTIDEVTDTDGIEIVSLPMNSEFPLGFLIAQDGKNKNADQDKQHQNFKIVDWRKIVPETF